MRTSSRHLALTTLLLSGAMSLTAAIAADVTWNPLGVVAAEPDTLLLPDLTSAESVERAGGFALGAWEERKPATEVYEFGPGRRGPAFRGKTGAWTLFNWPADGLIPGDEFTIEFSFRADKPWAAMSSGRGFFALSGGNRLEVSNEQESLEVWARADHRPGERRLSLPLKDWPLDDQQWHALGLTLKDGVLTVWLDGKKAGELKELPWGPLWSDTTHADGLMLGGTPGISQSWFWISDFRISRTARVPGQPVPLRPLEGTLVVDARRPLGPLPPHLLGALHPATTPQPGTLTQALQVVRTDKLLVATPIKRGPPDADHPAPGRSGRFSYDWRVADRTLDWMKAQGVLPYLSLDATPQLLGGSVPPFSGDTLKTTMSFAAGFGPEPPTNLDDWAAVVGDLVHHIRMERGDVVPWWGVWNEPAGGGPFWNKGLREYLELYAATVQAVRAVDPAARVGGPEVAGAWDRDPRDGNWIKGLIDHCAQAKLPLDFISYHDYAGSLLTPAAVQAMVAEWSKAAGLARPPPLLVGEFNWTAENAYKTGKPHFNQGMWHLRALTAAYTTAFLTRLVDLGGIESLIFSHTGYGNPRDGSWSSTQLIGPHGERWAPFNALAGWKSVMRGERLAMPVRDLPPGVFAAASRNPRTGRVGLALANYGFAQRQPRQVNLTLTGLPAGRWRFTRWLVDAAHSSRWDLAEDRPEGAAQDGLAQVAQRPFAVQHGRGVVALELPPQSATFIALDPVEP